MRAISILGVLVAFLLGCADMRPRVKAMQDMPATAGDTKTYMARPDAAADAVREMMPAMEYDARFKDGWMLIGHSPPSFWDRPTGLIRLIILPHSGGGSDVWATFENKNDPERPIVFTWVGYLDERIKEAKIDAKRDEQAAAARQKEREAELDIEPTENYYLSHPDPLIIRATSLWETYDSNAISADSMLKGHRITVFGTATGVRRSSDGVAIATIAVSGHPFNSVICAFDKDDESTASWVISGYRVKIDGICVGAFGIGNVLVAKCVVTKIARPTRD